MFKLRGWKHVSTMGIHSEALSCLSSRFGFLEGYLFHKVNNKRTSISQQTPKPRRTTVGKFEVLFLEMSDLSNPWKRLAWRVTYETKGSAVPIKCPLVSRPFVRCPRQRASAFGKKINELYGAIHVSRRGSSRALLWRTCSFFVLFKLSFSVLDFNHCFLKNKKEKLK